MAIHTLNFSIYQKLVDNLLIGKRLPDAVYLHESSLDAIPVLLADFVTDTVSKYGTDFEWNILKLHRRDYKVTLLSYPGFDEESYPPLDASLSIDLIRSNVRHTNYSDSENPPILHRKETLVSVDYPLAAHFAALTKEGERAGLYEHSRKIGFRKNWERLIAKKGYALIEGHVVRSNDLSASLAKGQGADIAVQRHLTAVDRDKLSTLMQSLARQGYLDGDFSILDYGCGKGHDLLELEAHGIDAVGWDPAYRPDGTRRPSDIVNLGFVINVIEDRQERTDVLREAFSLAKRLLVVSAMLGGQTTVQKFKPYQDGVITTRGTFQKYYTQAELRDFIESGLQTKAVAIGPGVFFIFKDELDEQEFLAGRQRIKREWNQLLQRDRQSPTADYHTLIEKHIALLKDFWSTCLDLGRPPANDEFDRSDEIRRVVGSHRKAFAACKECFGSEEYEKAAKERKKDLTIYLALSFFDPTRTYSRMPIGLQRDIRAFFEQPSDAYHFAREALFAIADAELIGVGCVNARERLGCGYIDEDGALTLRTHLISELPPILRIYVGCAAQLYGDIEEVDLVKIHVGSGKVTLLTYDDFGKPIPFLISRVKIRMKDQTVDFFNYSQSFEPHPLYLKSRFLSRSDETFESQRGIDELQLRTGLEFSGYGPLYSDFINRAARLGLYIPDS